MPEPDLITPELLRDWSLPDPGGSKQARGRVLVVGGAAGSPGGVALAGLAALRVGTGKVQLALAASVAPAMAAAFPEAGVIALAETDSGSILGTTAAEQLSGAVTSADAVLIGPGLDDADEADALLRGLLPAIDAETAIALDAYALGALPGLADLDGGVRGRPTSPVLTPNVAELGRLLEREVDADQRAVVEAATSYEACVTAQTLIADRDARSWRVPSGHPGLATAGSGDVLAGLVAGLLAREASSAQAACWGTYLHSVAGERLASSVGGIGFLARELVDHVPPVLAELS